MCVDVCVCVCVDVDVCMGGWGGCILLRFLFLFITGSRVGSTFIPGKTKRAAQPH